ncbi:MAG: CarD family transcriptional regulator [Hyphomicrobiales bacterium]|nr:CarD family transcriptional regulator [Hyphomicrobiales bacterium]
MKPSGFTNQILSRVSLHELQTFRSSLTLVDVGRFEHLLEPFEVIDYVYFPEDAVCSVQAFTENKPPIEVGMFGKEGMSNFVVRPGDRSYFRTTVLLQGRAWRLPADVFAKALGTCPSLNEVTLRFKDTAAIQYGFTSFANGSFTIEQRLARWLLMAHDRIGHETIGVVHDSIALLLAVRRSGVTNATHVLESTGAIKATRGTIVIRDRQKLLDIAGESYGSSEIAYAHLMTY